MSDRMLNSLCNAPTLEVVSPSLGDFEQPSCHADSKLQRNDLFDRSFIPCLADILVDRLRFRVGNINFRRARSPVIISIKKHYGNIWLAIPPSTLLRRNGKFECYHCSKFANMFTRRVHLPFQQPRDVLCVLLRFLRRFFLTCLALTRTVATKGETRLSVFRMSYSGGDHSYSDVRQDR